MSARLYPVGQQALLDGTIVWTTASIKALLLSSAFAYDPVNTVYDDLNPDLIVAESAAMTGAVVTGNVYSGKPLSFGALTASSIVKYIVLYEDTGDSLYSTLIAAYDVANVEGLPFTPSGFEYYFYGDYNLGFFKLQPNLLYGPINTVPLGAPYTLDESEGGPSVEFGTLLVDARLDVKAHVCLPPDEYDQNCGRPIFRGTACA